MRTRAIGPKLAGESGRSNQVQHRRGSELNGSIVSLRKAIHEIEGARPLLFIASANMKFALPAGRPNSAGDPAIQMQLDVFAPMRVEGLSYCPARGGRPSRPLTERVVPLVAGRRDARWQRAGGGEIGMAAAVSAASADAGNLQNPKKDYPLNGLAHPIFYKVRGCPSAARARTAPQRRPETGAFPTGRSRLGLGRRDGSRPISGRPTCSANQIQRDGG